MGNGRTTFLLIAGLVLAATSALAGDLPKDWTSSGSNSTGYEMGVENTGAHSGKACAVIRNKDPKPTGFGTLMQNASPKPYLGKRVRLSAWVKAKDVTDWAGVWFRVDQGKVDSTLDNMQDRPIKGSCDWKKVELVLDVPKNTTNLAFGVLLSGPGSVWIDDLKFEKVSKKVKTTGLKAKPPSNLDFEK